MSSRIGSTVFFTTVLAFHFLISDHVAMNYPEILDSRFVAQPVDDFLFPWEEAGSAENPITIDEDEGFSETMTPQNTPPQ